jgi:MFS family permease
MKFLPRGYSRDIWTMFATNAVTSIGFSVSMPYLSLYLNNVLKIPMTAVGMILMVSLVIGAMIGIFGGELSDRMGRKWVMVRSLFIRCLIFVLFGFAIMYRVNIMIIVVLMIMNASLGSFFMPASQAFVADLTTEDKRISAYGLIRIGGNLGWALGPAIGGLLATLDYSYLFFFTGFCMFCASLFLLRFSRESLKLSERNGETKTTLKDIVSVTQDRKFLAFTLICLSIFIVWGQLVSPISVYSVNRVGITKTQLGILFSINGFLVVVFQYSITHLFPKRKELTALAIGALVYAVGYFTVGLAGSFSMLALSMVIITIGEMVITPASHSYASILADPKHRGRYLGFFNLSQSFGWAFGPLLGGILLDAIPGRSTVIWSIISGLAVFSALGFLIFKKRLSLSSTPETDG